MSSSELYEEIGRLKERVDDKREEVKGLKEDNETLNAANLAMHRALAEANENVRWLNHQLQAQDEEISKLPSILDASEYRRILNMSKRSFKTSSQRRKKPSRSKVTKLRPQVNTKAARRHHSRWLQHSTTLASHDLLRHSPCHIHHHSRRFRPKTLHNLDNSRRH